MLGRTPVLWGKLLQQMNRYLVFRRNIHQMATIRRKADFKEQMYEHAAWEKSELVCGIDEVGRSCLAGPVVAAAAILQPYVTHKYLKDSKVLSPEQREVVYSWLMEHSVSAVGIVHHRAIDSYNIYQATLHAMKKALMQLISTSQHPSLVLVDAMPLSSALLDIPIISFPFGERQSASIAAASIIAKVTRDRLIRRLDPLFPGYALSSNKGYGTQAHKQGLITEGSCIIHRMSFAPLKNNGSSQEEFSS